MTLEDPFVRGIRRVLVQMMFADGRVDADELETARDIHEQLTGDDLSEALILDEALALLGSSEADLLDFLTELSRVLDKAGKEMIVRCAFLVARGDESVDAAEESLVYRIGRALHMDRAHVRKVLKQSGPGGASQQWH